MATRKPTKATDNVTADVVCTNVDVPGIGGPHTASVNFAPDHAEDLNSQWAAGTPALSLGMSVKDPSLFEVGAAYTLTFEKKTKAAGEEG